MRVWVWVAFVAHVLSAALSAQSVYYLPQVVDGPNVRTTIVLNNTAATSANLTISLVSDDGSPRRVTFPSLGAGSQFSLTLKPGGAQMLQTDGSGDGSAGAATIKSSALVAIAELVSVYDDTGNVVSESAIDTSDPASGYVIPIDTTEGLNTGVALFNPGSAAANLTCTLFDTKGTKVESAAAALVAGGHLSRMAGGDLFPDVADFQGTLVISSTVPVAAVTFRQNSNAPSYTLLAAVPRTSMLVQHYLPELADGPSASGVLQSSFLLYNLSQSAATVTLALSQDSGAAWVVNIPGAGSNSTFSLQLPPGGSAFWQTDGQGVSTTGAASISSDQPIGVSAVVSASDAGGNYLGETAMTEARALQKFQLAVDTTHGINTGVALYNPTSQTATVAVNLLDATGSVVANTVMTPLTPGTHMTAYVSDLFPGTIGVQGSMSFTVGGGVGAAVSAVALSQSDSPVISAVPAAPLPLTGPGVTLTPSLDSAHKSTGPITPAGGTLTLTDARGNKFTLTIPAQALLNTETVTMTAVNSVTGLPTGGAFAAAVQLDPDGLVLYQPATLTIEPAGAVPAGTLVPLGWHSTGQGIYLNMVNPQMSKVTLELLHFSGAGIASGSDSYVTQQLQNIANAQDLATSQVSYWITQAHNLEVMGQDGSADVQKALDILNDAYVDIQHLMQLGIESGDDSILRCGVANALSYERLRQLLGTGGDSISNEVTSFLTSALSIVQQHALDNCQKTHDPLAGLDLLGFERQAQLLGLGGSTGDLAAALSQCSPAPALTFASEMMANGQVDVGGASATISWDSKLSAKVPLAGSLPSGDVATGGGDGYVSFQLSGSGPLKYDSWTISGQSSAPIVGTVCTITGGPSSGSTLTVMAPKSEIRYKFTARYNPQAVYGSNGATLASFCPVYDKAPVDVTLALDPGSPADSATVTCQKVAPIPLQTNYWINSWKGYHAQDGGGITGWQIPGSNSFAHKDISNSGQAIASVTGTETEKTTLDLNQPQ